MFYMTPAQDLLAFIVSVVKSGVILIGLSLHVTSPSSLTGLNIISLNCAFSAYVAEGICFLVQYIWSSIDISFFRLGKISSVILLKILTGPLGWEFLLSSLPITIDLAFSLCPGFPG